MTKTTDFLVTPHKTFFFLFTLCSSYTHQHTSFCICTPIVSFACHIKRHVTVFVKAREIFFYVNKHILRYSSSKYIYTYATNTCMLETQVTIYQFMRNIDDKKVFASNESLIIAYLQNFNKKQSLTSKPLRVP